jgi:antitoxin (DNA-binding transcriptional repressor) of toxin-antitoxin stability system
MIAGFELASAGRWHHLPPARYNEQQWCGGMRQKTEADPMATVTIQDAQASLVDLIHKLAPGEEVTIIENNQPVARLVGEKPVAGQRPQPGLCKDMITIVADDEEHLRDFSEYMP